MFQDSIAIVNVKDAIESMLRLLPVRKYLEVSPSSHEIPVDDCNNILILVWFQDLK